MNISTILKFFHMVETGFRSYQHYLTVKANHLFSDRVRSTSLQFCKNDPTIVSIFQQIFQNWSFSVFLDRDSTSLCLYTFEQGMHISCRQSQPSVIICPLLTARKYKRRTIFRNNPAYQFFISIYKGLIYWRMLQASLVHIVFNGFLPCVLLN